MRNLKYIVLACVGFIITTILQINIFSKLPILGVLPNIYIIYIIYIRIFATDNITPNILAIVFGIVFDICYGSMIGLHALIGFAIINITPLISNNNVVFETKIGMMIYVFICTFIAELICGVIYLILSNGIFNLFEFIVNILICAIYNFILTLFVHPIFSESIKEKNNDLRLVRRY